MSAPKLCPTSRAARRPMRPTGHPSRWPCRQPCSPRMAYRCSRARGVVVMARQCSLSSGTILKCHSARLPVSRGSAPRLVPCRPVVVDPEAASRAPWAFCLPTYSSTYPARSGAGGRPPAPRRVDGVALCHSLGSAGVWLAASRGEICRRASGSKASLGSCPAGRRAAARPYSTG